jgi:HEAT repeat protein
MKRLSVLVIALAAGALLSGTTQAQPDKFLGRNVKDWQKDLKSATATTRANAAFALGKIGPEADEALPALVQLLREDKDAGVRDAAAMAIGRIVKRGLADADVINVLCDLLTKDPDHKVKRSAAVALGQCAKESPQVRAALEKALDDGSKGVKQNAAWALGEVCENAAEPPVSGLRKALADNDWLVKRDAAIALGKLHAKDRVRVAVPDLADCVKHDYIELKKAACYALVELITPKDTKAVRILVECCKNPKEDIEVRGNAALALSNVGGEEAKVAAPVLLTLLRSNDLELKRRAALAFRSTGEAGKVAENDLIAALKHKDTEMRYNAAMALGGVKSHKAVPALVERIADTQETEQVRVAGAVALLDIDKCNEAVAAVPRLIEILDNPKQPAIVRWRILWSLRVHKDDLLKYDQLFTTMTKILTEPNLKTVTSSSGHNSGKMLRYDCAFLLGVLKAEKAPAEVLAVLQEFLQDDSIRIYTGSTATGGGAKVEGSGGGKGTVSERGDEDGRIMAIKALERIGPDRVKGHKDILEQLHKMAANNSMFEPQIRQAAQQALAKLEPKK